MTISGAQFFTGFASLAVWYSLLRIGAKKLSWISSG